ncbi:hypothetical protein D187_006250 [Cystobacter fuscus DSM 2262]|uniref:Uncharacterized protein n=1 Tax=Cystobacter fuscus (strain ATCC 25194 / DSM 2262 / NBRC 100088 / M29) TaxID=1242864 RepID=S9PEM0_CYSF2|nr:hypothetical protein [Cystobacter fuscus]EPX62840.1 hypothetical protein D187_006250 [Cystobacter fuscus DSM 2262]
MAGREPQGWSRRAEDERRTNGPVLFLSSTGEVLTQPRVTGFLAPKDFLVEMRKVK